MYPEVQNSNAKPAPCYLSGLKLGLGRRHRICCDVYSPHLRKKSFNTSAALSSCATSFLILLPNVLSPWLVTYFCTSDMKLKLLGILERFVPSLCCIVFLTLVCSLALLSPTSQVLSSLSLLGDVNAQHRLQRVSCCCDASFQLKYKFLLRHLSGNLSACL